MDLFARQADALGLGAQLFAYLQPVAQRKSGAALLVRAAVNA
jgi:hypothetical protein